MSTALLRRGWIPIALLVLAGVLFYLANLPPGWLFREKTPIPRLPGAVQNRAGANKTIIRAGGDQNYPPYSFLNHGQPDGFDVELIRAAAQAVGLEVEVRLGPWNQMREAIERGEIDVLTGMAYSQDRDHLVDFTTPHAAVTFDLFVPQSSTIRSLDDLHGKQVIVQLGGLMEDYLVREQITRNIFAVPNPSDALRLLSTGAYDAALLNKVQGLYFIEQLDIQNARPAGADFLTNKYSFAVRQGNDELLLQLNQGLSLIKANGQYQEIYDRWLGVYENNYFFNILHYVLVALAVVILLLAVNLMWSWSLQEQVERRTRELRKSEEELRRSEDRFRTLFEQAPLSYQSLDQQGRLVDVNDTWLKTLGYATEEVQGKYFGDLLFPGSAQQFTKYFQRYMEMGVVYGVELEMRHKNGSKVVACFDGRVSYDEEGRYRLSHCIFRDVTEQHRAKEALRQLEDRFEKIFRASPDLMVISRLSDGNYVEANQAFYDFTGFQPNEVIGRTAADLMVWANPEERSLWLKELRNQGEMQGQEFIFRRKDGRLFTGLLSARLIDFKGEPCILGITRDITERKRSEEVIRQQMEYLSALQAIDMAIISSGGLDETLQVLLEQVIRQLQVDSACVLLYNPGARGLEYGASLGGCNCCCMNSRLALGEGFAGKAVQRGQIIRVADVREVAEENNPCVQAMCAKDIRVCFALPLITKNGLQGVLEILHSAPLVPDAEWMRFLEALANQAAIAIENATLLKDLQQVNQELSQAYDRTIEGWAQALELRDIETRGHSRRVADLMVLISRAMGIEGKDLVQVRRGALMHDVGKMGIPDSILFKPGALNREEMEIMKKHVEYGYQMLSQIDFIQEALDIPYCHHEKWDGSGYPRGLKGNEIPLSARIFAIVDVWDALRSDRPYRHAWPKEKAIAYLQEQSGKHFDPRIVEVFLSKLNL